MFEKVYLPAGIYEYFFKVLITLLNRSTVLSSPEFPIKLLTNPFKHTLVYF